MWFMLIYVILKLRNKLKNIVSFNGKYAVKPLVWISSIGIYDEVPGKFGEWNNEMLGGGLKKIAI